MIKNARRKFLQLLGLAPVVALPAAAAADVAPKPMKTQITINGEAIRAETYIVSITKPEWGERSPYQLTIAEDGRLIYRFGKEEWRYV